MRNLHTRFYAWLWMESPGCVEHANTGTADNCIYISLHNSGTMPSSYHIIFYSTHGTAEYTCIQCTCTAEHTCTVYRYGRTQVYSVQVRQNTRVQCTGTTENTCTVCRYGRIHVYSIQVRQNTRVQCTGTVEHTRTLYRYGRTHTYDVWRSHDLIIVNYTLQF